MTPKAQQNKIIAAEGLKERSVEPPWPVSRSPSPTTQGDSSMRKTRSATAQPQLRTPQNVAESILALPARPEDQQTTAEGKSPTPADIKPKQKEKTKEPCNLMDKTIASKVTKGGSKGRKSANGSQSRGSSAGSGHKTTILQTNLAAMLEYFKKEELKAATVVEQAYAAIEQADAAKKEAIIAVEEAATAGEEVKTTLERAKRVALESNKRALARKDEALREKKEAIETKEQLLKISEHFREEGGQ